MSASNLLRGLRSETGATAAALVSRDGLVIEADLPPDVHEETFSIMCAAIMGAAMTATNELNAAAPRRIELESADVRVLLYAAGRRSMLVVVLPSDADPAAVDKRASLVTEQVAVQ